MGYNYKASFATFNADYHHTGSGMLDLQIGPVHVEGTFTLEDAKPVEVKGTNKGGNMSLKGGPVNIFLDQQVIFLDGGLAYAGTYDIVGDNDDIGFILSTVPA